MSSVRDLFPTLMFCPYLQLPRGHEFADYWIGPLDEFKGSWAPAALADAARVLMSKFVTVSGKSVERPTIIASLTRGVDGQLPAHPEALRLAVAFGALVCNPRHPLNEGDAWRVITADNCDVWLQPIDVDSHRITLERGSRVRTMDGGYRFTDDDFRVPPPLELHLDGGGLFDADVADAVYRVLSAPESTSDAGLASRLAQAIRWWVQAWRNSASISLEDRVVHLRIATDALVGADKTDEAIVWLTDLFAAVASPDDDDLLWPGGPCTVERRWGDPPKVKQIPQFEHWFRSFADARNEIIHEGAARSLSYTVTDSPFSGPIGDRRCSRPSRSRGDPGVSRALRVPNLWRTPLCRAVMKALDDGNETADGEPEQGEDEGSEDDESGPDE